MLTVLACSASLLAGPALGQAVWQGGVSSDAADALNWTTGSLPNGATDVELRTGENADLNLASDATWNTLFFNSAGETTINGAGTLTLNSSGNNNAILSAGGPLTSTINTHLSTPTNIQTNGQHSLTFNGNVAANKIEAFGGTTATFNGDVTVSDQFITVGGDSSVVFNGNYHWASDGLLQTELGINGQGASDVTFTSFTSDFAVGVNIVNIYDDATVHIASDYVFQGATGIWSRRGNNHLDLAGNDEAFDFIGSDMPGGGNSPDPNIPVIMGIDFGATQGANSLVWATSNFMGGSYPVTNFEVGVDTLEFGINGPQFFTDDQLGQITINGVPYAASDPGDGSAYWTRDSASFPFYPAFFNLPTVDLPGDYNDDGQVDAADYTVWRDALGTDAALPNDLTPGAVTPVDYDVWLQNYGASGGVAVAAAPEPATFCLACAACLAVAGRRLSARRPC
ncbi:hypothetical protein [Posidoniimonas corsicana]|nr:hypothetical protein [Posidoniimonas corsicana]